MSLSVPGHPSRAVGSARWPSVGGHTFALRVCLRREGRADAGATASRFHGVEAAIHYMRDRQYPLRRTLNRADELDAETNRLALEESSGRDQFSLCLGMKFDASHRSIDRAFLNTSFAGIPATAPLCSSRNRRSASLSHRASQSGSISGSRLSMRRTARRARALAGSLRALDSTSRAGSDIRATYHRPYPVPITGRLPRSVDNRFLSGISESTMP